MILQVFRGLIMLVVMIMMLVMKGEEVMLAFWIITNVCLYVFQTIYMLVRHFLLQRGLKKQ